MEDPQIMKWESISIHPGYNQYNYENDIAIITLRGFVRFNGKLSI